MYKYLICDMDGTLLPPSGGLTVSKNVEKALIQLQQKGITIILASARIFQGVEVLARQIHMDKFGGYIISSGGTYCLDVKNKEILFNETINKKDALSMWRKAIALGVDFGIGMPSYMLASGMSEGFNLDRINCGVEYILSSNPENYIKEDIWKCSISQSKIILDTHYQTIVNFCKPYQVIRSTENFIDIIDQRCSKEYAVEKLFNMKKWSMEEASAIGDGNSDASMIKLVGYGVTLENGSDLCKKYAKRIVSSCYDEGCLELIEELMAQ